MAQAGSSKIIERPLRGRDDEFALLLESLDTPGVRAVVIVGPAGVGKSALARSAAAALPGETWVVGGGKFDPGAASGPAAILAALESAAETILEDLYDPEAALGTLAAALKETARAFDIMPPGVLRDLAAGVPGLPPTVNAGAGAERLAQAAVRLARWLAGVRGRLLLVLDDWGRADEQASATLHRMLDDCPGLQVLATERQEEPGAAPRRGTIRIPLGVLAEGAALRLLQDLLDGDADGARLTAGFLGQVAELTPFELVHDVTALREARALHREDGRWNLSAAKAAEVLGGTVADVLVRRLAHEPAARSLAQVLAVFGEPAAQEELVACSGRSRPAAERSLARLRRLGVVSGVRRVAFAHDRLRDAVLQTLSRPERRGIAHRVAETLLARGAAPGVGVGAVMLNCRLLAGLDAAAPGAWTDAFQSGATAARLGGAGAAAASWADAALALARRTATPSPAVLREAVFAQLGRGEFTSAAVLADEMLACSAGPAAVAEADEMRILARRAAGDIDGAVFVAREGLARAGIVVPERSDRLGMLVAAVRVLFSRPSRARRLAPIPKEELDVYAPLLRATAAAGSLLYEREPMLAILLGVNAIPLRLAVTTPAGAATYSALCASFGVFRQAERWARFSDELQAPGQPLRALALQYSTNFGLAMVEPRQSAGARLAEMERMAYAEGDLAVAAYANRRRVLDALYSDRPLARVAVELEQGLAIAQRLGDQPTLTSVAALNQMVECLAGEAETPWRLAGRRFDEATFQRSPLAAATHVARHVHALQATLAAAFGAYEAGAELYQRTRRFFRPPAFQLLPQTWFFATALSLYRTGRRPDGWRLAVLRHHVRHNPTDHAHRLLLLEAERLRVAGRRQRALVKYQEALSAAQRSGCLLENGIVANACAEGAAMLGAAEAAERFGESRDAAWRSFGASGVLRRLGAADPTADAGLVAADDSGRELELAAARKAAERVSRAKSRLLADVAHELRTPLQGAVGYLETTDGREGDQEQPLRQVLRQLSTVVDDLADMASLEAGGITLAARPFNPAATLRQVAEMHQAQAEGRLSVTAADAPSVLGDEMRVRQVLSNLAANAIKHGAGAVSLELRAQAGEPVRLEFEVRDRGAGIPVGDLATIFEPFRRRGAEGDGEGLGLGLPIARRIARAMGGDLTAEPCADGARFLFRVALPAAPRETAPVARHPGPLRVLLAEDVRLSRRVIARLLEQEGCVVVQAPDGAEALALARAAEYDAVVTDERMPGLRGSELARRLRSSGFGGPILITAGADDQDLRAATLGVHGVQILIKPVGRRQLRAFVASALASDPPRPTRPAAGRIEELKAALGDAAPALFAELRPELMRLLEELRRNASALDRAATTESCHRIGGLAAHFGLEEVAELAAQLEMRARGDAVTGTGLVDAVEALAAEVARLDWRLLEAPVPG